MNYNFEYVILIVEFNDLLPDYKGTKILTFNRSKTDRKAPVLFQIWKFQKIIAEFACVYIFQEEAFGFVHKVTGLKEFELGGDV